METIKLVLEDFYSCSKLPIKALDMNFKNIYSKGYDSKFEKLFSELNIIPKLKKLDNPLSKFNISDKNNINFLITTMSKYDKNSGYYILGPYNSNDRYAIDYLLDLLATIHEDKFSKGRTNLKFSSYVKKSIEYSLENYDSNISIQSICDILNINKSYFCKKFKQETGYTFSTFLNILRIEKSKKLLTFSDSSLLDISISVGFNSQNYYTMVFKKLNGITPLEYRKCYINS